MISKLTRILFYLLTGISVLAVLSPLISPKIFWPASIPGLLYIYLLIFQVLFCCYWIYRRDRMAIASFAAILIFVPYINRTVSFYPMGSEGGTDVFRIATYNIYGLKKFRKAAEKKDKETTATFRKNWADLPLPDIMCVQEANGYVQQMLSDVLKYPHLYKVADKDLVLYSRHRLLRKGEVDLESRAGKCYWADINTGTHELRIYCVHLESNRVSLEADRLLREGNLQEKQSWKNAFRIFGSYMTSARDRAGQVKRIREHISESPLPVILAGDLNDTPVSYTYQQISRGLSDAFVKNTRGISSTYGGIIPFLRIDYVFMDPQCQVLNYHVADWPWSDHYPIFAEIALDSLSKVN